MVESISRRRFLARAGAAGALGAGLVAARSIDGSWTGTGHAATGICGITPGEVHFPSSEVIATNADAADTSALMHAVATLWRRYLAMDAPGVGQLLTADAIRMSGRFGAGQRQASADAVVAGLPFEWSSNEQLGGRIAEEWTIRRAELWVDPSGTAATAMYWADIAGGSRWCYTDLGLVLQMFTKEGGAWRVAHWTESYNVMYDLPRDRPAEDSFAFDFSHPVDNLCRATSFYTELCGPPESFSDERTVYNLRGSRFVLDGSGLLGVARVDPGLPNGWATIFVRDLEAERERLKRAGVRFMLGTGKTLRRQGPDLFAIALDDPKGASNPFVLMQRNLVTDGPAPATLTGFAGTGSAGETAARIAEAWVGMRADEFGPLYGDDGRWFDDTRTKGRGLERGPGIAQAMTDVYWPRYDRSPAGLSAGLVASDVHTRTLGARTVVSHRTELTGTGVHPYRETSMVTHVLGPDGLPILSMTVAADPRPGLALSLDYTGAPTTRIPVADTFYTRKLRLGPPYVDAGYRGWWSDTSLVYGVYKAGKKGGLLRPKRTTGYMSFWVPSAQEAHRWLKDHGSTFPLIKAINSRRGVDPNPGYTQVLGTDPECNALLLTEYTGN